MGDETTTAQAGAETFEFKNPQTNQNVILPKMVGDTDMKSFLEGVIAKSNEFARKKYQSEMDGLRGQLSEADQLKARIEELENINLPAKDREAKEQQKSLTKFQKELETERNARTQVESILKTEKLNNALMREASKYPDIIDIEQTTTLFQAQCSPTLSIDGDTVKLSAKLNGEETEFSEAFTKWLASDRNANLLKNKLNPGSGSAGGSRATQANTMKRAQFDALGDSAKMEYITKGGQLTD
jgi:hypothetical protein